MRKRGQAKIASSDEDEEDLTNEEETKQGEDPVLNVETGLAEGDKAHENGEEEEKAGGDNNENKDEDEDEDVESTAASSKKDTSQTRTQGDQNDVDRKPAASLKNDRSHSRSQGNPKFKRRNDGVRAAAVSFGVGSVPDEAGELRAVAGNSGQHYRREISSRENHAAAGTRMTLAGARQHGTAGNVEDPVCLDLDVWEKLPESKETNGPIRVCDLVHCDNMATCSNSHPACDHKYCERCAIRFANTLHTPNNALVYCIKKGGQCPLHLDSFGIWTGPGGLILSPMVGMDVIRGYFHHNATPRTEVFTTPITCGPLWNGLVAMYGNENIFLSFVEADSLTEPWDVEDVQEWIAEQQEGHVIAP
jgi:hypothetical protein